MMEWLGKMLYPSDDGPLSTMEKRRLEFDIKLGHEYLEDQVTFWAKQYHNASTQLRESEIALRSYKDKHNLSKGNEISQAYVSEPMKSNQMFIPIEEQQDDHLVVLDDEVELETDDVDIESMIKMLTEKDATRSSRVQNKWVLLKYETPIAYGTFISNFPQPPKYYAVKQGNHCVYILFEFYNPLRTESNKMFRMKDIIPRIFICKFNEIDNVLLCFNEHTLSTFPCHLPTK
jgi:hypothetical protein